jgi:hypothetical protein
VTTQTRNKQTSKQTNKPTNKQTNKQPSKQTNKQTNIQANTQTDQRTNTQTNNQTHIQCFINLDGAFVKMFRKAPQRFICVSRGGAEPPFAYWPTRGWQPGATHEPPGGVFLRIKQTRENKQQLQQHQQPRP